MATGQHRNEAQEAALRRLVDHLALHHLEAFLDNLYQPTDPDDRGREAPLGAIGYDSVEDAVKHFRDGVHGLGQLLTMPPGFTLPVVRGWLLNVYSSDPIDVITLLLEYILEEAPERRY